MGYVKIPKDLGQVEPRLLFFLTKKQLIAVSIGLGLGLPLFLWLRTFLPSTLCFFFLMLLLLPVFLLGFGRIHGIPAEIYGKQMLAFLLQPSPLRLYDSTMKGVDDDVPPSP